MLEVPAKLRDRVRPRRSLPDFVIPPTESRAKRELDRIGKAYAKRQHYGTSPKEQFEAGIALQKRDGLQAATIRGARSSCPRRRFRRHARLRSTGSPSPRSALRIARTAMQRSATQSSLSREASQTRSRRSHARSRSLTRRTGTTRSVASSRSRTPPVHTGCSPRTRPGSRSATRCVRRATRSMPVRRRSRPRFAATESSPRACMPASPTPFPTRHGAGTTSAPPSTSPTRRSSTFSSARATTPPSRAASSTTCPLTPSTTPCPCPRRMRSRSSRRRYRHASRSPSTDRCSSRRRERSRWRWRCSARSVLRRSSRRISDIPSSGRSWRSTSRTTTRSATPSQATRRAPRRSPRRRGA